MNALTARANARGCSGGFGTRMATTNNDDVKLIFMIHAL